MISIQRLNLVQLARLITGLGSLAGLIVTLNGFRSEDDGAARFIFLLIASTYFLVGVVMAVRWPLDQGRFRRQCAWFWYAQVPVLSGSYFSFHAATGAFCALWLRIDVYDVGFSFGIASQFEVGLMAGDPFVIGVNIFAIAMILLLKKGVG